MSYMSLWIHAFVPPWNWQTANRSLLFVDLWTSFDVCTSTNAYLQSHLMTYRVSIRWWRICTISKSRKETEGKKTEETSNNRISFDKEDVRRCMLYKHPHRSSNIFSSRDCVSQIGRRGELLPGDYINWFYRCTYIKKYWSDVHQVCTSQLRNIWIYVCVHGVRICHFERDYVRRRNPYGVF